MPLINRAENESFLKPLQGTATEVMLTQESNAFDDSNKLSEPPSIINLSNSDQNNLVQNSGDKQVSVTSALPSSLLRTQALLLFFI